VGEGEQDKGRVFEARRVGRAGEERLEDSDDRRAGPKDKDEKRSDSLPERLRQKYYVVEDDRANARIFADPHGEYLVAKTSPDRLMTRVANLEVVRDLVAIAAHRGWEKIELSGALEFRREAWRVASIRGIEVNGYEPTELDRAALAKLKGRPVRDGRPLTSDRERGRAGETPRRPPPAELAGNKGGNDLNVRSHLALIERVALAAFPKDPEARSRILNAARERMANHRRSGAHFDRAEIIEKKVALEPGQRRSAERTKALNHVAGRQRIR
jgi:hypothetical protein